MPDSKLTGANIYATPLTLLQSTGWVRSQNQTRFFIAPRAQDLPLPHPTDTINTRAKSSHSNNKLRWFHHLHVSFIAHEQISDDCR